MSVQHLPLFHAEVCQGLMTTPPYSTFFPLLPSDIVEIQSRLLSEVSPGTTPWFPGTTPCLVPRHHPVSGSQAPPRVWFPGTMPCLVPRHHPMSGSQAPRRVWFPGTIPCLVPRHHPVSGSQPFLSCRDVHVVLLCTDIQFIPMQGD